MFSVTSRPSRARRSLIGARPSLASTPRPSRSWQHLVQRPGVTGSVGGKAGSTRDKPCHRSFTCFWACLRALRQRSVVLRWRRRRWDLGPRRRSQLHGHLPSLVLPTPLAKATANALLDHVVVVGHELWKRFSYQDVNYPSHSTPNTCRGKPRAYQSF